MDLKSLDYVSSVTVDEFRRLFAAQLGDILDRGIQVLLVLGDYHSFRVSNVLYMAFQKGIVDEVLTQLERWCALFPDAVRSQGLVMAHVDTRLFFDALYSEYFLTDTDTANGVSLHALTVSPTPTSRPSRRLWTP